MSFILTREQLYELVWSEAMQSLGKKIGMSDVGLAKHCKNLAIPLPERGYWNKRLAGKAVSKSPLSPRDLATINDVELSGALSEELSQRLTGRPGDHSKFEKELSVLTDRFRTRLGKVTVAKNLSGAHPAIAKLLSKDQEHGQKRLSERYYWREPKFDSPFEQRRLRVLNAIFVALSRVGAKASTRGAEATEIYIGFGRRHLSLTLDRPSTKHDRWQQRPRGTGDNDKLSLRLAHTNAPADIVTHWDDEADSPIEDRLTEIVVAMMVSAERLRRIWSAQQSAWLETIRLKEEQEASERREEAELRRQAAVETERRAHIQALLDCADQWRQARTIRELVTDLAKALDGFQPDNFAKWSEWALQQADCLDPVISGRVAELVRDVGSNETCAEPTIEERSDF